MGRFKYTVDDDALEDGWELDGLWDEASPSSMASEAAGDYFSNHDGWEARWPVEITLYRMDDTVIGRFKVELEAEPTFYAKPIASKQNDRKEGS